MMRRPFLSHLPFSRCIAVAVSTFMVGNLALSSPLFGAEAVSTKVGASKKRKASASPSLKHGFADIVQPLLPAVVNVSVIRKVDTFSLEIGPHGRGNQSPLQFREFLEQFELSPEKRRVPVGAGSGFLIDPKGYVVTNAHVVEAADEVRVVLSDKQEFKAKVLGTDKRTDLALLKIEAPNDLPYVKFGDSSAARVGNWAIAIGNALGGLGGSVTIGVISHVGRSFSIQPSHIGGFLQTDAQINLGNSGGPLFNTKGEVIGVNMMIAASPLGGNSGIGFAIPSEVARFVIGQLRENGKVTRGWLGIHIQDVTPDLARSLDLRAPSGALVGNVIKGGPAGKAGVKRGDLILKINGSKIENASQTNKIVGRVAIGKTVKLDLWRANPRTGKYGTTTVVVTISENDSLDNQLQIEKKKGGKKAKDGFVYGLTLKPLDEKLRQELMVNKELDGLFVARVHPESKASETFNAGDILLSMDHVPVSSMKDTERLTSKALKRGKKEVLCLLQRRNFTFYTALSLDEDLSKEKEK